MKIKNTSLRSAYELLPLGTRIMYHHRAAPARHQRAWKPEKDGALFGPGKIAEVPRGWKLKEGIYSKEYIPTGLGEGTDSDNWIDRNAEYVSLGDYKSYWLQDVFFNWHQAGMFNKTVMVWPTEGAGVIMGIIRRAIGSSHSGYTSGYEYPEYNPPYFSQHMYIDLYVVKEQYEGTEYILCPLWAVKED